MNLNDYVKFNDSCKQFEIVTGTQGKYSYDDVIRVSVLNEKAKYKGKGIPFTAVLPGGPLPSGLFQNPYLYVGVKIRDHTDQQKQPPQIGSNHSPA